MIFYLEFPFLFFLGGTLCLFGMASQEASSVTPGILKEVFFHHFLTKGNHCEEDFLKEYDLT